MNYYYELTPGTRIMDDTWPYWCLANCNMYGGRMPFLLHDEFMAHSRRVWLENANGVHLVKPDYYGLRHRVDSREFALVKLKARIIKYESE